MLCEHKPFVILYEADKKKHSSLQATTKGFEKHMALASISVAKYLLKWVWLPSDDWKYFYNSFLLFTVVLNLAYFS